MTPYYQDDWLTVYQGDCRAVMAEMEPESVHCVVTSPPYWGLRDYGTATWLGGDEGCDHLVGPLVSGRSTLAGYTSENITGRVAQRLGRRAVLIDLSGDYLVQAMQRNQDIPLGLESA